MHRIGINWSIPRATFNHDMTLISDDCHFKFPIPFAALALGPPKPLGDRESFTSNTGLVITH
jgi:hypothetical protein